MTEERKRFETSVENSNEEIINVSGGCGAPSPKYSAGNIIKVTLSDTETALYEILSVVVFESTLGGWVYNCVNVEGGEPFHKNLDTNPNVSLERWIK